MASGVPSAEAFTIDTRISHGCHERMTLAALAAVGWPEGQTPPAPTELERRALADLSFELEPGVADPWTLALLIGVRENDLDGLAPSDLPGLSELHGDPELQREHCLRAPEDDGPEGDASALLACRRFVLESLARATNREGRIDLEARVEVSTYLAFRERTEVSLQRFGFYLGRALHAIQDSYSHTFRDPEDGRIRHVLNFVDFAREDDYSEARDGHRHSSELDDCGDLDRAAPTRALAAQEASAALLRAVLAPAGRHADRVARVEAVLDGVLGLQPGCTAENRWCDAPELALVTDCACRAGSSAAGPPALGLALLGLLLFARRARSAITVAAILSGLTAPAVASETDTATATAADGRLGLYLGLSAALDRGAFAGRLGVRWQALDALSLGLDAEWNPWFSLDAGRAAPGAFNLYATGSYRWVNLPTLELHTSAHLGASVLLFDLVGADAGSVGLYLGLSLLGVAVPLGERWRLVFEPAELAFPMPQLRGLPFYYRQYRMTLGLQWNP